MDDKLSYGPADRKKFIQIDDRKSQILAVGPFLFNLYVSDLDFEQTCYQYADDTTILEH